MSEFVEVKTAELAGPALDWAVAKCSGMPLFTMGDEWAGKYTITMTAAEKPILILDLTGMMWREYQGVTVPWEPSSDWGQGGPLRDKYDVGIEHGVPDGIPYAYLPGRYLDGSRGETALIALCRAIVAAKLGEVVQIPTELAGVHR